MLLSVIKANYLRDYMIALVFNDGESETVDLKETIFNDHRKIFDPLRQPDYFRNFKIKFNTIVWENEADFAPEFLLELGKQQQESQVKTI